MNKKPWWFIVVFMVLILAGGPSEAFPLETAQSFRPSPQRALQLAAAETAEGTPRDMEDIRDIKAPIEPSARVPLVLMASALILLLIPAVHSLGKRFGKGSARPRPACETAREAIETLKGGACGVRDCFSEMSRIARDYIGSQLSLAGSAMTTEEFLHAIRETSGLSPEQNSLLSDFLRLCDLVKYAGHEPSAEEADRSFATLQKIIEMARSDTGP